MTEDASGTNNTIALTQAELVIIWDCLRAHLPAGTKVWVFGSRATGTARRYSDLDLALDQGRPLSPDLLGAATEALSESDLPFKVDLVDLQEVDPGFRALIEPSTIPLPRVAGARATGT